MMETTRFDIIDADGGSIQRARSTDHEVTNDPLGDGWIVAFEDSEDVHEVLLHETADAWKADCWKLNHEGERTGRCPGWAPCAHMWAVRSTVAAHNLGRTGDVLADGGRIEAPPAGHDGRTFGRPEAHL
jgi:hypothetical protein